MRFDTVPQASGGAYVRLNASAGAFSISVGEGETAVVDLSGKIIALDLKHARQGWLHVGTAGVNWVDLKEPDVWEDRPSKEHKPGADLGFYSDSFPADPKTRDFRTNSQAGLVFVRHAIETLGIGDTNELPEESIPTFKIEKIVKRKAGSQITTDITLKAAPRDKWVKRDTFEAGRDRPDGDAGASAGKSEDNW